MTDAADGALRGLQEALESRAEILEAYLFGSRGRGEPHPLSDYDVAVYLDPTLEPASSFEYQAALAADLMRALGTSRVDVVVLNRATPLLYHRVLRDGRRLMSRDIRATTAREGRALSRYCDFVPQLAKIERALSARIARGEFGR